MAARASGLLKENQHAWCQPSHFADTHITMRGLIDMESKYSAFPPAFKAVNKETGEELGLDKIEFSKHECYHCCNSVEIKPGDEVCPFCCRAPLSSISTEFSLVFWGWIPSEKVALLQQTGFTDAADKPVHLGDVIFRCGLALFPDAFLVVQVGVGGVVQAEKQNHYPMAAKTFCGYHVVGNCYEPPSKWIERAEAIYPDAELPREGGAEGR